MRPVQRSIGLLLLLFASSTAVFAQFDPEGAQVFLYFPQLADGGGANQQWITSFTFVNPHYTFRANGAVSLYGDDGSPLSIDFGSGPVSTFNFVVPPQGSVQFVSTGASASVVTGWAIAASSLPLEGVVQFRYAVGGVPQQGVAAQATTASNRFRSPATASTGIAVANPYASPLNVYVAALDTNGNTVANSSLTLPALGHQSFNVNHMFPSIASTFSGSVVIRTDIPNDLVAWTLSADFGVLASYPPSGLAWPVSQYQRIWKAWQKTLNAASQLSAGSGGAIKLGAQPNLVIDYSTGQINSYALQAQNEVHIFMNLAELISDSESELGFVVAHEVSHIIQYQNGHLLLNQTNPEWDADELGMWLSLVAGYDPYAAAGALAKLSMASGTAGLVDQNFDNLLAALGIDPHGSFDARIALVFDGMKAVCAMPQAQSFCQNYKSVVHPHLPAGAPLAVRGVTKD